MCLRGQLMRSFVQKSPKPGFSLAMGLALTMPSLIVLLPIGTLNVWAEINFVGLPFVVHTVQPAIDEIEREVEQAAATLVATLASALRRVVLPMLTSAALTRFDLTLASNRWDAPMTSARSLQPISCAASSKHKTAEPMTASICAF